MLLAKCLGRRICAKCGKNYNVADIRLQATDQYPSVVMPPLPPSEGCKDSLVTRPDDNKETFRRRMEASLVVSHLGLALCISNFENSSLNSAIPDGAGLPARSITSGRHLPEGGVAP